MHGKVWWNTGSKFLLGRHHSRSNPNPFGKPLPSFIVYKQRSVTVWTRVFTQACLEGFGEGAISKLCPGDSHRQWLLKFKPTGLSKESFLSSHISAPIIYLWRKRHTVLLETLGGCLWPNTVNCSAADFLYKSCYMLIYMEWVIIKLE